MVDGAAFLVAVDTAGVSSAAPALDSRSGLPRMGDTAPFGGSPPRGVGVVEGGVVFRPGGCDDEVREERMDAADVFLTGCGGFDTAVGVAAVWW